MTALVAVTAPGDHLARYVRRSCRSRSRYGDCGRDCKHEGPHAVPIGDGVWFGYIRDGRRVTPLSYGHLRGDTFTPINPRPASR